MEQENPTKNIPNIEPCIRIPKFLSLQQAQKIQKVFTIRNCRNPYRNNAIMSVFLSTGIRVSELINIDIKDIDFNHNTIIIFGKGNKQRKVYFSDYCKQQILKYLTIRFKENLFILNEPLFINIKHNRIGIDGIENICKQAYALLNIHERGYSTHTLRHTAAYLLHRYSKADILLLKEFLGHKYISTTEVYTHAYNEEVKEAIEKNPLKEFQKIA